ncbi:MAG: hypothetical protein ACQET7_06100 [Thermodesulfobacteriota bacterium]
MTARDPITFKGAVLNLLLLVVWATVGYVVFLGGACVWVGICSVHRQGFWVPILVGCLTIAIVLRAAFPLAGGLRAALQRKTVESGNGSY